MTFAELTPSSLHVSLEQLTSAKAESDCAAALVNAAALMQGAILANQSAESFHAAIDACAPKHSKTLSAVMERAINFHELSDGGTLGLWLLPVVVSAAIPMPSAIALEAGLQGLKMSSCLLQQLGLSCESAGGSRSGWTFVVPTLYSDEAIRSTDMGELVKLPHAARDFVRGDRKTVPFVAGVDKTPVLPGARLYYLPFVAYNPEGLPPSMPASSNKTMARMSQWLTDSLKPILAAEDFVATVGYVPQPFAQALRAGDRLYAEVNLRESMVDVCTRSGVEPNGLAALVAPYATRQSDGTFMVGVSMVSRLTQNVVGTLELPAYSEDGEEEIALTIHVLKDMGMECVQDSHTPITTIACQHCGNVQFAMPDPAFIAQVSTAQVCGEHAH